MTLALPPSQHRQRFADLAALGLDEVQELLGRAGILLTFGIEVDGLHIVHGIFDLLRLPGFLLIEDAEKPDPGQLGHVLGRAGAVAPPHDVADALHGGVDRLLRGQPAVVPVTTLIVGVALPFGHQSLPIVHVGVLRRGGAVALEHPGVLAFLGHSVGLFDGDLVPPLVAEIEQVQEDLPGLQAQGT